MFLKKSKSRTEVFVILPDKPKKLSTSSMQKEHPKMRSERNFVMKEKEAERKIETEKNNNNVLEKGFSDLMWVKPSQGYNGSLEQREIFDIINMGKSYERLKEKDLQQKACDVGYHGDCNLEDSNYRDCSHGDSNHGDFNHRGSTHGDCNSGDSNHGDRNHGDCSQGDCSHGDSSDQSLTSSSDDSCTSQTRLCKSLTRPSSRERKSVRFSDELSDSFSSYDGNDLPIFTEAHDGVENYTESSGKIEKLRSRFSHKRTRKFDSMTSQCSDPSDEQGLLGKRLSENPLNLHRLMRSLSESNFVCHQCDKTFKYQSNLRTHVKNIHSAALWRSGSQTNLRSIDDLYICDVCSLAFKYSVNFRAHKAGHTRNKLNATI